MITSSPCFQSLRVIINPRSGTVSRRQLVMQALLTQVKQCGAIVEICETKEPRHAVQLAQEAAQSGIQRVLAVGGDGTVNEIVRGLEGSDCSLAIIPMGSGNGLARHLQIPLHPDKAVALALSHIISVFPIDVGHAGDSCFMNVVGVGIDADIARLFGRSKRRGLLPYVLSGARALRNFQPIHVELRSEQTILHKGHCLIAGVCNSGQYGNQAVISPSSDIRDGFLEFVAVQPMNYGHMLLDAYRMFRGKFNSSPRVQILRIEKAILRCRDTKWFHVDGEVMELDESLRIAVRKRSLGVIRPPH